MKKIVLGILLAAILLYVVFEMSSKYETVTADDYVAPTDFTVDIDGIKYKK